MYDNQSTTSPLKSRFRCYTESPTVPANTSLINLTGSVQEMGTLSHARKAFHAHVHVHQYITCTKYDHS